MPEEILSPDESVGTPTSNSFTYECSKHTVNSNVEQADAIYVCHQKNPRDKSRGWSRSPFDSVESRFWWGRWQFLPLLAIHVHRPPTSFVTVKWNDRITTGLLAEFREKLGRSVREFNKRYEELRVYSVLEINRNDVLHAHLLVRTELETDVVADLLDSRVARFSRGLAAVTYCEEIRSDEAVSRYSLKFLHDVRAGEKEVLLFEKGLTRVRTQSCYFKPWQESALRKEGRIIERKRREQWHRENGGLFPTGSVVLDSATEKLLNRTQCGSLLIPG